MANLIGHQDETANEDHSHLVCYTTLVWCFFFLYVKIKSVRETLFWPFFGNFHARPKFSRTL